MAAVKAVAVSEADGIATVEVRMASNGNSLTRQIAVELAAAVSDAASARCIVLRTEGTIFCSGADLAMLEGLGAPERAAEVRDYIYEGFQGLIMSIASSPVPVIARVQGPALGAGADLALACDLRIASENAWLEESWIKIGTISALGGAHTLAALLGPAGALDLLLTGRRMTAGEGANRGVFQRVVPSEHLDETVAAIAQTIASRDSAAVRAMKRLVRSGENELALRKSLIAAVDEQVPLIARTEFGDRVRRLRRTLARPS